MPCTTVLALALVYSSAAPADSDRVLRRVPAAEKLTQQHRAAEQRELETSSPECTAAALRGRDLLALRCQVRLLGQAAGRLDLAGDGDRRARERALRRRAELAVAALELGQAAAAYRPVNRIESLDRQRFEARALSCQPLGALYDALVALPASDPLAAALQPGPTLPAPLDQQAMKDLVCGCGSDAVALASAAFVPPSDPLYNEAQRTLYARGCFLDVEAGRSSLVDIQRRAPATGPASLPDRPAAGDRAGELRRVAASREFQLGHCKERLVQRRQRAIDRTGIERCVCEVASKWRFSPCPAGACAVDVELVPGQVRYTLTVEADGKVGACALQLADEKK